MKKLFAFVLTAILCLCCLASCGSAHEENEWFSEDKLTECLVGDLPMIEKDYVNHNDEDIYVSFTDSEFKAYIKSVYDYLCSEEYKYLGTRGDQKDTLAGAFTTYYFEPATELESFRVIEGDYVFVFSDGSTDENGDVEFIVLVIYDVSANTLEYGNKKFTYNTQISLRRGSEAPLSGFYVLKEEEQNTGEWEYDQFNHWIKDDAQIPQPHEFDSSGVCTACGFDTFKDYHLTVIDNGNWLIYDRDDVYEEFDIIKFHTHVHPIEINMYVDGEFYSSGSQVSINENYDYIEYRFVMPNRAVTVEFKTDLISYSGFLMLYPWLGNLQYKEVNELVIEKGGVGVSPDVEPEMVSYTYSGKIADIMRALRDMRICQVSADSDLAQPVEGGSYIKYTFVTDAESYVIYVANRRIEANGYVHLVFGEYPIEAN